MSEFKEKKLTKKCVKRFNEWRTELSSAAKDEGFPLSKPDGELVVEFEVEKATMNLFEAKKKQERRQALTERSNLSLAKQEEFKKLGTEKARIEDVAQKVASLKLAKQDASEANNQCKNLRKFIADTVDKTLLEVFDNVANDPIYENNRKQGLREGIKKLKEQMTVATGVVTVKFVDEVNLIGSGPKAKTHVELITAIEKLVSIKARAKQHADTFNVEMLVTDHGLIIALGKVGSNIKDVPSVQMKLTLAIEDPLGTDWEELHQSIEKTLTTLIVSEQGEDGGKEETDSVFAAMVDKAVEEKIEKLKASLAASSISSAYGATTMGTYQHGWGQSPSQTNGGYQAYGAVAPSHQQQQQPKKQQQQQWKQQQQQQGKQQQQTGVADNWRAKQDCFDYLKGRPCKSSACSFRHDPAKWGTDLNAGSVKKTFVQKKNSPGNSRSGSPWQGPGDAKKQRI